MDKHNELDRFDFIRNRDGADEARLYAQRMIDIYRANCKSGRKKYGKNYPYRAQYVESIYSFRYLLKELK